MNNHYISSVPIIIIFVSTFLYEQAISAPTNAPVWVTSEYIQAKNYDLINTLTDSSATPQHNFTFDKAFSGRPLIGYGLKGYEGTQLLIQVGIIWDKKSSISRG